MTTTNSTYFTDWINHFTSHLEKVTHSSANTREAYQYDLESFHNFVKQRYSIQNPTISDWKKPAILGFLSYLVNNGYTARSVSRKLSSLRAFAKFLILMNVTDENPTLNIPSPKLEKRLPQYFTKKEMRDLLALPDTTTHTGLQDRVILELFYAAGLRVSELVALRLKDVDFNNNNIRVLGKRNKVRIVPIGQVVMQHLKDFFSSRESFVGQKLEYKNFIFVNKNKEIFTRQQIAQIVRSYIIQISDKQKAHPHALRHTFATHLLDEGADIMSVKELLGHANLSTTQIYTHVSVEHLKRIYKQAHPRAD